MTNRTSRIIFAAALLLCASFVHAQVTVAIAPNPHPQFLDASGKLLASGFLYTYQAGTTTLLNTYVDSTGNVQNADPIPLDVTGAPSNGSTQTGIWLANTAYKFCAYNAAMVQQWCTDNVTGYLGLLNLPNLWTFQQTYSLPIVDTATNNQLVIGAAGNQTTLDFPPPTGNIALHMPSTPDTMVGRVTTDTLTNKTLSTPTIVTPIQSGAAIQTNVAMPNGPATYISVPNDTSTGTQLNTVTKLSGVPARAILAATTDTGGLIGITVSGNGNTGSGIVQQTGIAQCLFDGQSISGDYVQASATLAGDCHDIGSAYPTTGGQILGRALTNNIGPGLYTLILYGPEVQPVALPVRILCADGTTTTVNTSTTAQQPIKTCTFPANSLSAVKKSFRVTVAATVTPGGAGPPTSNASFGWGTTVSLGTYSQFINQGASASSYTGVSVLTCAIVTTGVGGTASCAQTATITGGSAAVTNQVAISLDTTAAFVIGDACSFSGASASNTCSTNSFTVEQLN